MEVQKSLKEIESQFKSSIVIPKNKPNKQFFICPVGLVGTGKTTVIKPISERLDLVRFSSDELRKLLKENGYDYASVKDIGLRLIRDLALQGYNIAFDMDCGNPAVKEFAENLAKELGIDVFFLHITAPENFVFDKFKKHPPSWLADNPQIMIDNYLAQKETRKRENTHFDFYYTFDTSRSDIQNQIEDFFQKIAPYLKIEEPV